MSNYSRRLVDRLSSPYLSSRIATILLLLLWLSFALHGGATEVEADNVGYGEREPVWCHEPVQLFVFGHCVGEVEK